MTPALLLLLLLPRLLLMQVTPDFSPETTVEEGDRTDSSMNTRGTSDNPVSPDPSWFEPDAHEEAEENDWSPAETFLYSGDPSVLETGTCSRAYSLPGQNGPLPDSFYSLLLPAMDALTNTANFLNMIFQASDLRESSIREDLEWYHALTRALLEAHVLIDGALLTFDADPTSSVPQLVLRASRNPDPKVQTIILEDLSKAWDALHPPAPAPDSTWFSDLKFPESGPPQPPLSKRVLINDLSTLDTPKWGQGDSYVTNRSRVRWASAPFLECKDGRFLPRWRLTLSTSFYGLKPDLTPEFRGVVRVDVSIQSFDVDQCAAGDSWFADTHQCNRTTMKCQPITGQGFRLGQYCCRCKDGYYSPSVSTLDTDSGTVNRSNAVDGDASMCYPALPICLPCWPGCKSCQDDAPCWVQEDWFLRSSVLAVQGIFMLLVFVSMLAAYKHRRSRRIRASGLLLLETILFGSLLLYFPVFILYFKPSTFRCILLRWVRMLGFSIVYGTVTLKMYRVLKVFLSRTAQRVPYMSSFHLLRLLGVMLLTVSWFLCAWTVGVLQNRNQNIPVFITTTTSDRQGFSLCYLDRWDYMMAVAELLFLCWGSSLCNAVRPVPSAFHEPRYMGIAIHNELLLSSMFHLFRFLLPSLHPDWMLLLFFTHTHVTITITLSLLFLPKFLHVSKLGREEITAEVYEEEVDLRRSCSYLNSSFHSAWSEHSLDPDDIRDELKKLYAQLEVHKTKKMTINNPHLPKKRSSRCGLGRSIIKRIAEIPESMSRQCSREEKEVSYNSKAGSRSGSFRRFPDTICSSYKESLSPVMRKSHSEHDYVRERDTSLRDSMLRSKIVKRASQRSETDSLDIPPGVCKSASALNLTINNNLLHPDHSKLHKSWSLSSTDTHSMEDISKVNRASSMNTKYRQEFLSIKDQTTSALQSQSFDKAEVCPWELEDERLGDKNQKHVTYAPSQDAEIKSPDTLQSPLVHVCPWDHLPPPLEQGTEAESDCTKPQASVSASAPGTPRPKVSKDQRVFSFRNTTHKWLSVKSFVGSMDAGVKDKPEDSVSQKSQESGGTASMTPKSTISSRNPSKRSMTTPEGKPCLVKQNAIRLSSGDSSDRSPRRLVIVKSAVYPWNLDDLQKDTTYENIFTSRQSSIHSNASFLETGGAYSRTPSMHRRGSNQVRHTSNASAGVCTWDVPQRKPSTKAEVCPWEDEKVQVSELASVCPWDTQERKNVKEQEGGHTVSQVCPWETQDIPATSNTLVLKQSQFTQESRATDICPWESVETQQLSKRQEGVNVNVCPWAVQDKVETIYENVKPTEIKESLKVPSLHESVRPNVPYPQISGDMPTNGKLHEKKDSHKRVTTAVATTAELQARQINKTEESCPWEFQDPPKIMTDICPWEGEHQDQPEDFRTDVCPWGNSSALIERKDSLRENIYQIEEDEASKISISKGLVKIKKQDSIKADVCPWESEGPEISKMQTPVGQDKVLIQICPWDKEDQETVITEFSKGSEKLQSSQADICPWETAKPEMIQKQESTRADVCTSDIRTLIKQDSTRADVCPWETSNTGTLIKQDSTMADVCPWETSNTGTLIKQDSTMADVCPWEAEDPKDLNKKENYPADICPWDSEDKQKFTESKMDATTSDQDEVKETQETFYSELSPVGNSTQSDEECKANVPLSRCDALCPWDLDGSRSGLFTELDNTSDVFTWEPENIPEEEEDEEADAECAAEAFIFPSDY